MYNNSVSGHYCQLPSMDFIYLFSIYFQCIIYIHKTREKFGARKAKIFIYLCYSSDVIKRYLYII